MSETLKACPNVQCRESSYLRMKHLSAVSRWEVICQRCGCRGAAHRERSEAAAAWNTRPDDGVREAEDRGYKRAVKMVAALVSEAMIYEDSYGVIGSEFPCCMACDAGGAPGRPFKHRPDCIVLKCETIADDFWQEQRDELNALNEENEQLRAALRTQGEKP